MADEEEKIRAQIDFADGTFAFIKDIIPDIAITENGITELYHEFILTPTPRTKKKWKLKEKKEQCFIEIGRFAGYYGKRYKKILCQVLDPSPKSVWLLHCDWNGKPIDIFKGQLELWRNILSSKDAEIQSLINLVRSLRSKLRKSSKNFFLDLERDAQKMRRVADTVGGPTILNQGEGGQQSGEPTR